MLYQQHMHLPIDAELLSTCEQQADEYDHEDITNIL